MSCKSQQNYNLNEIESVRVKSRMTHDDHNNNNTQVISLRTRTLSNRLRWTRRGGRRTNYIINIVITAIVCTLVKLL